MKTVSDIVGGLFEFTDKKITLFQYAQYQSVSVDGRTDIGFFGQQDIIDKRKTTDFNYSLDGDVLTLSGFMGQGIKLHRQR